MAFGNFPFGEPIREVCQEDRAPKCVFVLGVYASAVHARWIGPNMKERIKAVGVASEPYIFWRGDGAEAIIARISIPPSAGSLEVAAAAHNGPSGIALDDLFLAPLRIDRREAWLSDLVPHSCMNSSQEQAIKRSYEPLVAQGFVPPVSWPTVPTSLTDEMRRTAILGEIVDSGARTVMLLGDQPIKWFLGYFDARWTKLSDFGRTSEEYGRLHRTQLQGLSVDVLPLVHPRQAAGLGRSNLDWRSIHANWVRDPPDID